MARQPNSNLQSYQFAEKAIADIINSRRTSATGQSRMIAAMCYAHAEGVFAGEISALGTEVNLETAYRDVDTRYTKPVKVVSDRLNFILAHLFNLLYWDEESAKWEMERGVEPSNVIAAKMSLRRTLPVVAHLIKHAGEGPVIIADFDDDAMQASGAACALVTGRGMHSGRLKVRADLMFTSAQLQGTNGVKALPMLLDGSAGRTVEALARTARERLGVQPRERQAPDWGFGSLDGSLQTVRSLFAPALTEPELVGRLPAPIIELAKDTCFTLLRTIYADQHGSVDLDRLEAELEAAPAQEQVAA